MAGHSKHLGGSGPCETRPWLFHCEKVRKYTTTNYYSFIYSTLSLFSFYCLFILVLHHQNSKGGKKRFRRGKAPLCHPSKTPMEIILSIMLALCLMLSGIILKIMPSIIGWSLTVVHLM